MIGFAVDNLGFSELSYYLIRAINECLEEDCPDITVFYSTLTRPILPLNTASMQMTELYGFAGVGVATNFHTAQKLLKCPAPQKKIFYIYDLEWIRNKVDFSILCEVYRNPSLELVTRSEDYANVVSKLFHREVAVKDFYDIIHEHQEFPVES